MEVFDLLEVIKDTDKPIMVTCSNLLTIYAYHVLAVDSEMLVRDVKSLRINRVDDKIYYVIELRG